MINESLQNIANFRRSYLYKKYYNNGKDTGKLLSLEVSTYIYADPNIDFVSLPLFGWNIIQEFNKNFYTKFKAPPYASTETELYITPYLRMVINGGTPSGLLPDLFKHKFDSLFNYISSDDDHMQRYGTYPYYTYLSAYGKALYYVLSNKHFFDIYGDFNIYIIDEPSTFHSSVTIKCLQRPYIQVLRDIDKNKIIVKKLRIIYEYEEDIKEPLTVEYINTFGEIYSNVIQPSSYQTPNYVQSKMVDIPLKMVISSNTVIWFKFPYKANQKITFIFTVD